MSSPFFILAALLLAAPTHAIESWNTFGSTWEPPGEQMLMHRLTKVLLHNSKLFVRPPTEPVVAATCVIAPTSSDFVDFIAADKPVAPGARVASLRLRKPAATLKDVFHLLRQTRTGRAVLAKFDPKFGFEVKIEQQFDKFEHAVAKRAAALFDIDKRTIYINRQEEVGNLAPILLHEIVHSLDKDYRRAVEKEKELWGEFDRDLENLLRAVASRRNKPVESLGDDDFLPAELNDIVRMKLAMEQFRDVRIYRAERVAYDLYFETLKELAAQYPEYYLSPGRKLASLKPFSDRDLTRVEGLSPVTIQKYQKGLCKAFK